MSIRNNSRENQKITVKLSKPEKTRVNANFSKVLVLVVQVSVLCCGHLQLSISIPYLREYILCRNTAYGTSGNISAPYPGLTVQYGTVPVLVLILTAVPTRTVLYEYYLPTYLPTSYLLRAYYLLPTTYYLLPTTYTTYYLLPTTTYYLIPTT